MGCVNKTNPKEGAHAFTEESYHIERRGASVDVGAVAASKAAEGPRLEMHRRRGLERGVARGRPSGFGLVRLLRHGRRALGPSGVQRLGGRLAEDAAGAGTSLERRAGRR